VSVSHDLYIDVTEKQGAGVPLALYGQAVTLIDDLFDRLLTVKCFLTFN